MTLLTGSSITAVTALLTGLLCLKSTGLLSPGRSLPAIREQLHRTVAESPGDTAAPLQATGLRMSAFLVPLCDVSLLILLGLTVIYHLPALALTNLFVMELLTPLTTTVVIAGLFATAVIGRQRLPAVGGAILLPLLPPALLISYWPSTADLSWYWIPAIWAATAGLCRLAAGRSSGPTAAVTAPISDTWLLSIVCLSCFWLAAPLRLAAGIALGSLVAAHRHSLSPVRRSFAVVAASVQLLLLAAGVGGLNGSVMFLLTHTGLLLSVPVILLTAAVSVAVLDREWPSLDPTVIRTWNLIQRIGILLLGGLAFGPATWQFSHAALLVTGLVVAGVSAFTTAIRRQKSEYVWYSLILPTIAPLWLFRHGFIHAGSGVSQTVILTVGAACLLAARLCRKNPRLTIAAAPLQQVGLVLPALVVVIGTARTLLFTGMQMSGMQTLALFGSAVVYFHQALVTRDRRFAVAALVILNVTLSLLCVSFRLTDAQFYLVPIGLSIIGLVELMNDQLPRTTHDVLRYLGALTVLVSPVFEILDGSWLHLLTLMVFSVVVILLAIGLRVRALMYTGSAFLVADLIAMVVRSGIDHPSILWICGVLFGATVIGLAAICENHRDRLLQRIRFLSAELATWR